MAAVDQTNDATEGFFNTTLAERDAELFASIKGELGRQRHEVELIASENIVSRAVMEAQGSVMTNKYAEGYPGRRYYGGCEFVDIALNHLPDWLGAAPCVRCPPASRLRPRIVSPGCNKAMNTAWLACDPELG